MNDRNICRGFLLVVLGSGENCVKMVIPTENGNARWLLDIRVAPQQVHLKPKGVTGCKTSSCGA